MKDHHAEAVPLWLPKTEEIRFRKRKAKGIRDPVETGDYMGGRRGGGGDNLSLVLQSAKMGSGQTGGGKYQ